MPQSLYPPGRPQTIGEVLDTGFRIFRVSLVKCLPYGITGVVIGQLPGIYYLAAGQPPSSPLSWDGTRVVLEFTAAILSTVVFMALILRQAAVVTAQPTSLREELHIAVRRLPGLLVAAILYLLAVLVGLVLLVIPGIYVSILFVLFMYAIVLKEKGPIEALSHSARLVKGNWWRVATILTIATLIIMVAYLVIFALIGLFAGLAGAGDVAVVWAFTTVLAVAAGAFIWPFGTAISLAVFGDTQVRREGIDLEQRIAGPAPG